MCYIVSSTRWIGQCCLRSSIQWSLVPVSTRPWSIRHGRSPALGNRSSPHTALQTCFVVDCLPVLALYASTGPAASSLNLTSLSFLLMSILYMQAKVSSPSGMPPAPNSCRGTGEGCIIGPAAGSYAGAAATSARWPSLRNLFLLYIAGSALAAAS
jgi:hypothetical protein